MKKLLFSMLFFLLAFAAHSQSYQLNTAKSELAWTGRAAYSAYTLSGSIQARSGRLIREGGRIQEAILVIDMQAIRSEIAQLEKHLRSADFFEVNRFPEAAFTLSQPLNLESGAGIAIGEFTIKEVKKQERIPVEIRQEGNALVVLGRASIDRTAYGVYYNSPSFFEGLKQDAIADEFELSFRLVFEEGEAE